MSKLRPQDHLLETSQLLASYTGISGLTELEQELLERLGEETKNNALIAQVLDKYDLSFNYADLDAELLDKETEQQVQLKELEEELAEVTKEKEELENELNNPGIKPIDIGDDVVVGYDTLIQQQEEGLNGQDN